MYTNEQHIALDQDLSLEKNFAEAEICCREAIQLNPLDSVAHNDLGWSLQVQGDQEGAIACYKRALQIDPSLRAARRNLAILLVIQGHREASFHLWHEEVLADSGGLAWLQGLVSTEMRRRDLRLAGEYAAIHARLRCGSQWYSDSQNDPILPLPIQPPASALTIPKLRHDIEQFEYLQDHGVLGDEFTPIIKDYLRIVERLDQRGINTAVPLDDDDRRTIGHVYNRIVHIRHTPRVERALADKWNGGAVESQYIDNPPGIVIVDEFLSPEALESLRLFCLESTVWSVNRYAHGRLGAFFETGFNCPLLLQIAEEIRQSLPRVIGTRHPLRQVWAFKYGDTLPKDLSTHADFAAVNVNFWITPDDANLDATSGGLVIYNVCAPLDWDFERYQNTEWNTLNPFLRQQNAFALNVPYRQNRAVIFNSDLFHGTAALRFRPGYENRRVNVTMLYGDRENDTLHPELGRRNSMGTNGGPGAWRSAALTRARRPRT